MAVYHGKSASVKKNSVAIAGILNWAIETSVDLVEATAMGDTGKSWEVGLYDWGGTMEALYDPTNTEQKALQDAIIVTSPPVKLTDVVWFIDSAKNLSGNCWITNQSIPVPWNDLAKSTWTFKGDGALAYSAT